MGVAVKKAELDRAGRAGKMVEDRALIHAIAAPGPGQTQYFHLSPKAGEQLSLSGGELDLAVQRVPSPALFGRGITIEERLVA